MDWYSWLSKSSLEPSNVYDYTLLFTQSEIEEEDIVQFNHEFLKSMGISIAKHRLEILKLANKFNKKPPHHRPVTRLLSAVNRTKKCLIRYFNTLVVGRDRSAIVVVSKSGDGQGRWKGVVLKRNKRNRLIITDGGISVWKPGPGPVSKTGGGKGGGGGGGDGGRLWGSGEKEVRWDSMFQDMKPT